MLQSYTEADEALLTMPDVELENSEMEEGGADAD
jgi:hypothetical protein